MRCLQEPVNYACYVTVMTLEVSEVICVSWYSFCVAYSVVGVACVIKQAPAQIACTCIEYDIAQVRGQ